MISIFRLPLWLGLIVILSACGGGGSPGSGNGPDPDPDQKVTQISVDQEAFSETIFPIVIKYCVGCHSETSNTTIDLAKFAHTDSVIAHAVVTNRDLVDMSTPNNSVIVNRLIEDKHFCWTDCDNDANTVVAAIIRWNELVANNPGLGGDGGDDGGTGGGSGGTPDEIKSSVDAFSESVLPLVQQYCAACHDGDLGYAAFAQTDAQSSHDVTLNKDLASLLAPDDSPLVGYLEDREHHCWSDCDANASRMEGAIAQWQQLIADNSSGGDGSNRNPVAVADNYQTQINVTVTTDNVFLNDSDPDNDTLAISTFGAVSVEGGQVQDNVNGTFTYTPPLNFIGTDAFSYSITDGNGGTASTTVRIAVNANIIPVANDDLVQSNPNTSITITTLLQNDIVPPGKTLSVISVNGNTEFGGTAILNANNTVTYTPPSGFTGIDSFAYSISDGTAVSNALVRVDINEQPVAVSDSVYTYVDITGDTGNVLINDIDTNDDALTISSFDVASAQAGSVSYNGDGTFTYVPPDQFEGSDSFDYIIQDGRGGSGAATVFINVIQPSLRDSNRFLAFLNQTSPLFQENADSATAYYRAVDPVGQRTSLEAWRNLNGFDIGADAFTVYINNNDLGFSRRMFVRTDPTTGIVSAYVENYANLQDALSETNVIATVAMEHNVAPGKNPLDLEAERYTSFYVFDGNDNRALGADLDGRGFKFVPGLCNTCHGGRPKSIVNGVYPDDGNTNAGFIPWDLDTYLFDDNTASVSRSEQEAQFKVLNRSVLNTNPLPAVKEAVEGWYGGAGLPANSFNGQYVPPGWLPPEAPASATQLYLQVVAPYCRACHMMQGNVLQSDIDLSSYNKFISYKSRIEHLVFDEGTMPIALRTWDRFWENNLVPEILAESINSARILENDTILSPGRPIANAGPFREAALGRVDLNGNASLYFGGDTPFNWTLVSRPANSNAVLENPNNANTFFIGDVPGDYTAQLVVNDGIGGTPASPPSEVVIRVSPSVRGISFTTDISPIFERCAVCHLGFDNPRFNNASTLHDNVIDFVSLDDAINSPILTKPSGNHHGGGTIPGFNTTTAKNYRLMLRWILEGAADN
ncbi:MAG: tandem-95 repeat protein [Gammaproteobacteria bacterium]|nr:tandem-95 repeat protein [Gammaproteobacteria bacterium]